MGPAALGDTFKRSQFAGEVTGWLGRANSKDQQRFQDVFDGLTSPSAGPWAPREGTMDLMAVATGRVDVRRLSARPAARAADATATRASVPAVRSNSSNGAAAWTYTATRAAQSKPGSSGPLPQPQQQQNGGDTPAAQIMRDRELASLAAAAAARRKESGADQAPLALDGSSDVGGAGGGVRPHPADVTTYMEGYNLRNYYPEVYEKALREVKADPVPNYTRISEWGDSMKVGAAEADKLHMRSTYNTINDEVVKAKTDFEQVRLVKEQEFFKWMQRQKTYYGDLLAEPASKEFEAAFSAADDNQKRQMLDAMRQVHAVADPDQFKSHSQAVHCAMSRTEDPALTALLMESVKARTMGAARPQVAAAATRQAEVEAEAGSSGRGWEAQGAGRVRPRTAGAARPMTPTELKPRNVYLTFDSAAAAGQTTGRSARPATAGPTLGSGHRRTTQQQQQGGAPKQRTAMKHDTFTSKVPLKWAAGVTAGMPLSTYVETFGGSKLGAGRPRPSSAIYKNQAIKYKEVTCPIGAVNPHTTMAPLRSAYPVPESYLMHTDFPQPQDTLNMSTTYRQGYAAREPEAVARTLKAAAEQTAASHKALLRSTLPLGPRNGINIMSPAQWCSETQDEYVQHHMDVKGDYERALALKKVFTGPTASVGKVATIVLSPA